MIDETCLLLLLLLELVLRTEDFKGKGEQVENVFLADESRSCACWIRLLYCSSSKCSLSCAQETDESL